MFLCLDSSKWAQSIISWYTSVLWNIAIFLSRSCHLHKKSRKCFRNSTISSNQTSSRATTTTVSSTNKPYVVSSRFLFITGPPIHSVGGPDYSNDRWRLSSVTQRTCNVTHQGAARGGPDILFSTICISWLTHLNEKWQMPFNASKCAGLHISYHMAST